MSNGGNIFGAKNVKFFIIHSIKYFLLLDNVQVPTEPDVHLFSGNKVFFKEIKFMFFKNIDFPC